LFQVQSIRLVLSVQAGDTSLRRFAVVVSQHGASKVGRQDLHQAQC